jgi:uncharacterized protein (DUF488 family)
VAHRRHSQHGARQRLRRSEPITPPRIWTVGHSTRTFEAFVTLLAAHRIEAIADVRRFPGSRRHPQFGREILERALEAHGIGYRWIPRLGGRRTPRPDSRHTAWRNPSFRAYADHTETEEFRLGLAELLEFTSRQPTAVMCAEQLWWRCHRALIADVLRSRDIEVLHILDAETTQPHSPLV